MEEELGKRQERWPLCSRFFFLFFGSGAIVASVFSVYSCEFFSYQSLDGQPWEGLTPPFDDLASASVGLFRYSETISENTLFGESCINYEDWADLGQGAYFFAAQWCSLFAPGMAFLALLQITCECCMCRLKGSYILNRFFLISASVLQMCSFLVFSETQFCFQAASQNQCRLRNGAFYSLGSAITFLLMAVSSINMMPYKDVKSCMGCCVSTRVPRQRKNTRTTTSKVEGDTTSEDDGDRQNRGDKDSEGDDDDEKLLDVHNTRGSANRLVQDEEITVDQYSRQKEQQVQEIPSNENDVVAEILSTDKNDSDDGKSASASSSKSHGYDVVDVESPFPEQEQQQQGQEAQEIVKTDTVDSEQTRSPDFLDMCCGDPLELERYLGRKNDASKKLIATEEGANENTTPSLQSSLSKMAIEDESKGAAATLEFQYSKDQSDN